MPIEFILPDLLQNLDGKDVSVKSACERFVIVGRFRVQPLPNKCSVEIQVVNAQYAIATFTQEEVKSLIIEPNGYITINLCGYE